MEIKDMNDVKLFVSDLVAEMDIPAWVICKDTGIMKRAIASVKPVDYETFYLQIHGEFWKQSDYFKERILQHEVAHIYDRVIHERRSKHDKIFKKLCEDWFGDKSIGDATIKNWKEVL